MSVSEQQINNNVGTSYYTILIIVVVFLFIICSFCYTCKSDAKTKTEKLTVTSDREKNIKCTKGCYDVGIILFNKDGEYDFDENEKKYEKNLSKYEAYNKMSDGMIYGDIKYSLAAYCVAIGHSDCLKKLYKNTDIHWHADLADCAIEKDDLECLKVVIEDMGDITIRSQNIGKNCRKYIQNLDRKKLLKNKVIFVEPNEPSEQINK
jgi:hypothetical protein